MKSFLRSTLFERIKRWIIDNQNDIILIIGVILISLLSFAAGFIAAKQGEKEPLLFEETGYYEAIESSHCWSGDNWALFGLEIS